MAFLIGTDEAGYGPNLGPLVISATVWEVPGADCCDLYHRLKDCVARQAGDQLLAVADSKDLYQSGGSLKQLELGVLAFLSQLAPLPSSWKSLWQTLAPATCQQLGEVPWYCDYDCEMPLEVEPEELDGWSTKLEQILADCKVRLHAMRAVAVFPRRYNQLVEQHGGKGAALSHTTLDLVQELVESLGEDQIFVQCDKHGGRNRYMHLLQPRFPEHLIEVWRESRRESIYRWGPRSRRFDVRFTAGGESFLPSALASMVCKYLRELAMRAFNQFWCERIPGLRPTAGYPTDARRFRQQVQHSYATLALDTSYLWRDR